MLVAGAELLLAYAAQNYNVPLPVEACNAFLRACTGPSTDRKASTAAALALLHGMHAPLPAPNLETFSAVTLCILAHLDNGMPAYQLLVHLHEQVLPKLHAQVGIGPQAAKVYQAAMAAFNALDAQTSQRLHAPSVIHTVMLSTAWLDSLLGAVSCFWRLLMTTMSSGCAAPLEMPSWTKLRLFSLVTRSWHPLQIWCCFLPCLCQLLLSGNWMHRGHTWTLQKATCLISWCHQKHGLHTI